MDILLFLIPIVLAIGCMGLLGFLWTLKNDQFEDLNGHTGHILFDKKNN
jgi:cbb3-type cytochrome oxidase maturation protein